MSVKKYNEVSTGSGPSDSKVILIADPTTGTAEKVTLLQLKTYFSAGGGDTTAPTVTAKVVTSGTPNKIDVTFSESVTVTTAGWSAKKNGSAWSISSVSGSGTAWSFTMATSASNGDTLVISYDSTTGATVDASSNELVTFTDSSVTNNIGDTTAPTVTSKSVENATPDKIDLVFSESVTVTTAGWSAKKNGSAWSISSVSGSGTTWSFTMGSSAVYGDTIVISYDSSTGATVDGAANELVTFTDSSVANNIASFNGALTSVNKTAMTVSSGSFTATSLGTAAHAVADQYLPAGQAGGFTWEITTGNNEYVVGFNVQNEDVIYSGGTSGFEYGTYISGGSFLTYRITNGGSIVDLTNNGAVGDIYKMDRDVSGVVTMQRYRSGSWSTLYTWPGTNTGALYIGISPTNSSTLITISNMTAVNLHP